MSDDRVLLHTMHIEVQSLHGIPSRNLHYFENLRHKNQLVIAKETARLPLVGSF